MIGRLNALRELDNIQEMLIGEIRYGKATLPECCIHISGRLPEPYRGSMVRIHNRMLENTGICFGQVFVEEMMECLALLPVTEEDRQHFLSPFPANGFEDERMQIRIIEQSRELLGHTISVLEKENREKCRMAVGLGAMGGLLLLIVLL